MFGGNRDWKDLVTIIEKYNSFVFSTHLEPDADGLGAELGLARYLIKIGKQVHILNPSLLRANLDFLPEEQEVLVYDPKIHEDLLINSDVFIAFDIGHFNRLQDLCSPLESSSIIKISIDHHPGDKAQFDYLFDYPSASSTGVLIYDLLSLLDEDSLDDIRIAKPLYAAIMSDTGNFRFNNTDPETFHAAGRLVAVGVEPNEIYVHIYENLNTPGRLIVLRRLLEQLQYDCDGRLAWTVIDFEEMEALGATTDDLHSLSDFIRAIRGVEIGVSITKIAGHPTDVSLRSKGQIPVNTVALSFNGGGHAFAAGCRVEAPLAEAAVLVVDACRKVIDQWDQNA